jgi:hypothetical protein
MAAASRKTLKFSIPTNDDEKEQLSNQERKSDISVDVPEKDEEAASTAKPSKASVVKIRDSRTSMRSTTRLTQMFSDFKNRRARSTIVLRPIERFLPTYQLESKNPFQPLVVQEMLEKMLDEEMNQHRNLPFDNPVAMNAIIRSMSEEFLNHIRAKDYDRYRIIVQVTIIEKVHQEFLQNICVCWDIECDSLAQCKIERGNAAVVVAAFGIYYD